MQNTILIAISALLLINGLLWRRKLRLQAAKADSAAQAVPATGPAEGSVEGSVEVPADVPAEDLRQKKRGKLKNILALAMSAVGGFLLLTGLINVIFGPAAEMEIHFSIWAERVDVFGVSLGITIVYSWVVMAILIAAALIIRFTVFRNPDELPRGAQNVIETIVEAVGNYTNAQAHGTGEMLSSYILTIASFLVLCAMLELFRLRAPTSDIVITFSLALMTFILINVYGIKRKGLGGRLKSLASPTPIVFPFRLISEIAIPVSLACRLFGNMLGGMVVIDLLYEALGNNAVGIPGVLGLYFNAFHPLIQAFIFITLTLTFVNEAIE